jgi:hypothetical protein
MGIEHALILDDFRVIRHTEFAHCRNLQASPAAASSFAIQCRNSPAGAHKCHATPPASSAAPSPELRSRISIDKCPRARFVAVI